MLTAGWFPSGRAAAPGTPPRQVSITAVGEVGRDMAGTYTTPRTWAGLGWLRGLAEVTERGVVCREVGEA